MTLPPHPSLSREDGGISFRVTDLPTVAPVRRPRKAAEDALLTLDALTGEYARLLLIMDRTSLLRSVAETVRRATGAHVGMVAPLETDDLIVIRFLAGARGPWLRDVSVPAGLGIGGKALAARRPVLVDDYLAARSITHDFDRPVRDEGLRSMVAVPVVSGGAVAGVIYAGVRGEGQLGGRAIQTMTEIASRAGLALEVQAGAGRSAALAAAHEQHRAAIDLHDSVGAMLFRISAEVRALRGADGCSPAVVSRLATLENQVAEATAALREALMALHETAGEHELAVAVQGDCRAFEERTGVSASAIALSDMPPLDAQRQHVLRRVAREALLNVEKHARAGSVVVSLGRLDGGVTLVVTDDGVGMAPAAERDGGLGLASLEASVVQVGGTFRVVSGDDGGTTVRAWVPCL